MKWLTGLWHLPMVWDIIIPIAVLMAFALFLAWDSRLPPEKRKIMGFRKTTIK
jgi:hypothetical protein